LTRDLILAVCIKFGANPLKSCGVIAV